MEAQPDKSAVDEAPPGYLASSRNLVNSIILSAPLFLLYQLGILVTDGWRNGADFVTPRLIALTGGNKLIYLGINMVILAAMLVGTRLVAARHRPSRSTWLFVFLESVLYAVVLGQVIARVLTALGLRPPGLSSALQTVLAASPARLSALDNLVLSLGAGAYEELVFRLILFSGIIWLGKKTGLDRVSTLVLAFLVSSLLFAVFHYPPIGHDPWQLWSFSFRFMAGLVFAALFALRGFAVAAYTHALYDINVLIL